MKLKIGLSRKDVVVTLVCLTFLLATLGAVGATGRRRAKEVLCLSNLGGWGNLFDVYAGDHDGYFHEGYMGRANCGTVPTAESSNWWCNAVKPYYRNPDVCLCPMAVKFGSEIGRGDVGATFYAWSTSGFLGPPGSVYGSYGINGWVENNQCPTEPQSTGRRRWRTPNVAGGSNIPLLLGAQWLDGWPHHTDEPPILPDQDFRWQPSSHFVRFMLNRHNGFINGVFLDGSVRKVGLKELWTLKWHREYDTCGPWTQCGGVELNDWPEWMQDFEDY